MDRYKICKTYKKLRFRDIHFTVHISLIRVVAVQIRLKPIKKKNNVCMYQANKQISIIIRARRLIMLARSLNPVSA